MSEPLTKTGVHFDTIITISIYNCDDASILDECFQICDNYEQMLSATIEGSDIDLLNNSSSKPIALSTETIQLLNDSIYYSKLTDGLYDITIYPVSALWDFHNKESVPPNDKLISDSLSHVDYRTINITSDNTVSLSDPSAQIDLGSIAKGFIADKLSDYLISQNVNSAIINIGGDIKVIGEKSENTPFVIGIKDPNNTADILTGIKISNMAVATSGTYERCFEYNGTKYHHILNPKTGYPVETDISSVTVIANTSEAADALCTCSILVGSENAINLIENQKNTEAFIKLTSGEIIKSSGINNYINSLQ